MARKAPSSTKSKASADASATLSSESASASTPPAAPPPSLNAVTRSFGAIFGQDHALTVLRSVIASGRVHHAWIFHGPEGVGKRTTALAFAAQLLTPADATEQERARVSILLEHGAHPDLQVVTKAHSKFHDEADVRKLKQTSIPVDVVRRFVVEPARLAPQIRTNAPAAKVFVIDEAELMNPAAQNALLKTLEEPAERTVIILCTSQESALLATIRSRSQRVPFVPLSDDAMTQWMDDEGVRGERDWLIRFADGSPGAVRSGLAAGVLAWRDALDPMLARMRQGQYVPEFAPTAHALIDDWADAHVKANPTTTKEASKARALSWLLRVIDVPVRSWVRASVSGGEAKVEAAARAVDALRAVERMIDDSIQPQFAFEQAASEIVRAMSVR
ncbi:MAG: DNA polymerase III subunit [Planctomycetota bacterium]|nr:DNA polymerase III subunit [Planctomycetota bacterium]